MLTTLSCKVIESDCQMNRLTSTDANSRPINLVSDVGCVAPLEATKVQEDIGQGCHDFWKQAQGR
jgi:hypothetical protein